MPFKTKPSYMTPKTNSMVITKTVGAREFLKLSQSGKIENSRIVLPKLGSDSYGAFRVTLKK